MTPPSVDAIRKAISESGAQWEAGETPFTRLAGRERVRRLGCAENPSGPTLEAREEAAVAKLRGWVEEPRSMGYPSSYDLRDVGGQNFITAVKDQGSCGSCVSFGVVAAAEGTLRRQRGDPGAPVAYSEAHLFYCHGRAEGRNCENGWWSTNALNALRDKGIVDENCFQYTPGNQACNLCLDWPKRLTRAISWRSLDVWADMKQQMCTGGPLVAEFTVYDDFYAYRGGIYQHVTGSKVGGHCVCCVGFSDVDQFWIFKNSWGSGFGEQGFFRIAYGQCGIDARMYAIDALAEPAGRGIVVFRDNSLGGRSASVAEDVPDTRAIGLKDNISSIYVTSGCAVLYQDDHFRGRALYVESSLMDTAPVGFKDNISSIRLFDSPLSGVTVYVDDHYRGKSSFVSASISDTHAIGLGDNISSIWIHGSAKVRVYQDKGYKGKCVTVDESVADTKAIGMKDNISSIEVL